jgi:glycosylphosphatidylinositol transamidase (GPIT) subunit GPI8
VASILAGQQSSQLPVVIPPDAGHNVLVYWSGHGMNREQGGSDAFAWRDAKSGFTAALMKQTVSRMQQQAAFRKLLIVAEPCFAECVVSGLEGIPGVLAITGANAKEQSWADNWNRQGSFWMCDRFSSNFVNALTTDAAQTYRDLFLYCAQHTLGSHARIVNAAHFGNLYRTSPKEFVKQ